MRAKVGEVLGSRPRGLAMAAVLAVLYGLLYLILSLEDCALLAGAPLGFAALTTAMFATRRVSTGPAAPAALPPRCRGSDRCSRSSCARARVGPPVK
ncbi:MAG: inner membrane CreD family protein [Hyphomicrobiaceae bacterium]|jgi:inner membrane protein